MTPSPITRISLMGRLAYILMCIEAYLVHVYPDRDWRLLARAMWLSGPLDVSDWMYVYGYLTPECVLHDGEYTQDVQEYFTREEFDQIVQLYQGISRGNRSDPDDELCKVLSIPDDLSYRYDCILSDGDPEHLRWAFRDSVDKVHEIEKILAGHHIALPDIHRLDFLAIKNEELARHFSEEPTEPSQFRRITCLSFMDMHDIWGPAFDGESLSILLHRERFGTMAASLGNV